MTLRLDGRVAVVTGAGAGLGHAHALLLASQGARVVVNDIGGALSGDGGGHAPADRVVAEIRAAGGEAVASYDSVASEESAARIIATAVDTFGRIDILVNNAGILRDKSFAKSEMDDFAGVFGVHFWGSIYCTKAAWGHMLAQEYGRVIFTSSAAGIIGNFGQANYGSAKEGLLGLMRTLAIEGARKNIRVNAVSPGAFTRMTEALVSDADSQKMLDPGNVAPIVGWFASERCDVTATIIAASGGGFSRIHYFESLGAQFDYGQPITVDMIDAAWPRINDLGDARPTDGNMAGRRKERLASLERSAPAGRHGA